MNNRLRRPRLQPVAKAFSIVSFVGDQAFGSRHSFQERYRHADVSDVARGQRECDRSAAMIGQAMDLRGAAAPRAPDRLTSLPPFPPDAER